MPQGWEPPPGEDAVFLTQVHYFERRTYPFLFTAPRASPWRGGATGCPAILIQFLNKISSLEPRGKRLRTWEMTLDGPECRDILNFVILNIKPNSAGEPSPAHQQPDPGLGIWVCILMLPPSPLTVTLRCCARREKSRMSTSLLEKKLPKARWWHYAAALGMASTERRNKPETVNHQLQIHSPPNLRQGDLEKTWAHTWCHSSNSGICPSHPVGRDPDRVSSLDLLTQVKNTGLFLSLESFTFTQRATSYKEG